MGSGWFDAMGSGWFDAMGSGWFDARGAGGGIPVFPMAPDSPLADETISPFNFGARFPSHAWDADLYSLNILPEFLQGGLTFNSGTASSIQIGDPAPITDLMINEMLEMAITTRPQRLGEIAQQDQNFQVCWLQLLMMTHNSHPATYQLMKFMARVGEVVMIAAKKYSADASIPKPSGTVWNSARPSQICPTLYPPLPVPGHSTYPAGHAIIGQLTSICLKDLFPDPPSPPAPPNALQGVRQALDKLADRVSENRVIAGLHFPQDIAEGEAVAIRVAPRLQACPLYISWFNTAKNEWS
jgi:hypothetical protein